MLGYHIQKQTFRLDASHFETDFKFVINEPFLLNSVQVSVNGIYQNVQDTFSVEDNGVLFYTETGHGFYMTHDAIEITYTEITGLNSEYCDFEELERFWTDLFLDYGLIEEGKYKRSHPDSTKHCISLEREDSIQIIIAAQSLSVKYSNYRKEYHFSMDYIETIGNRFLNKEEVYTVYLNWLILTINKIKEVI